MDNKTFISRLTAAAGISQARATALTHSLGELLAEHCSDLDTVAIPQMGSFTGKKYDETIKVEADGRRLLLPPKIVIEFSPSAMLKKTVTK